MSRLRGTVWIAEEDASDDAPARGIVWTGRFSAHHDAGSGVPEELRDVTAEEAIAWGRERAPLVWIRLADGDWLAAGSAHESWAEVWDAGFAPQRRRPPGEEWRDRPEDAERISWSVQVDLTPPHRDPRPDWDAEVARIASRGGASGWRSRTLVTGAGPDEGWFVAGEEVGDRAMLVDPEGRGYHSDGFDLTTYRLDFDLTAATAVHAMEYGLDRCLVPAGWGAVAWAQPRERVAP